MIKFPLKLVIHVKMYVDDKGKKNTVSVPNVIKFKACIKSLEV